MKKKVIKFTPPLWEIVVINQVWPGINWDRFSNSVNSVADEDFANSHDELEQVVGRFTKKYPFPQYMVESNLIMGIDGERCFEWRGK